MASSMIFIIFATFTAFISSILATKHVVGDVFKYPQGAHNVLRVGGTAFQQCAAPAETQALTSGNDVINLTTPGRKWYTCGIRKHCTSGNMKLAITVLAEGESSPTSPAHSSGTSAASRYNGWIVLILGILGWAIASRSS